MSAGKPAKPLFDLLPRRGPDVPRSQPTPSPLPPPAPVAGARAGVSPRPALAVSQQVEMKPRRADLPPEDSREFTETAPKSYTISFTAACGLVAAVGLLLLATWILGALAGKRDAERRLGESLAAETRRTDEPTREADQGPGPSEPVRVQPPPTPTPPAREPQPGDVFAGGAWSATDPRIKGMNYLWVATLRRDDAVKSVEYLRGKGKEALAVPSKAVDRSPEGAKNPTYFVLLLTPLSREQYRDASLRARIETEVRELGKQWAKGKDRGPTDFGQPVWMKYE
jgi:hypothetical protein